MHATAPFPTKLQFLSPEEKHHGSTMPQSSRLSAIAFEKQGIHGQILPIVWRKISCQLSLTKSQTCQTKHCGKTELLFKCEISFHCEK